MGLGELTLRQRGAAARILFMKPRATSSSPFIIASKPVLATSAGSAFFDADAVLCQVQARVGN